MPLYNFDPQEEDWESELLDDRGRRMYNKEGVKAFKLFLIKLLNNMT